MFRCHLKQNVMRKRKPKIRVVTPDPRYGDTLVTQFVNNLMYSGKKSTAFAVFYGAMDLIKERVANEEIDEYEVWKRAINNAMPQVEVRSRRIGGATFQIPTEIRGKRKMSIGMKWLVKVRPPAQWQRFRRETGRRAAGRQPQRGPGREA